MVNQKIMPDWTAPFHLPKMSDSQFSQAKAEYIEKNGYTITIPGLSDIIKIRTEEPMTEREATAWQKRDWGYFSAKRLDELQKQKQKRKDRYTAMLASPSPAVIQSAGSIMTAIDDAQDATSTLFVVGQLGRRVAPATFKKLLAGPVGVLLTVSDVLNAVQAIPQRCMMPMYGKRINEGLTKASPTHSKAKLRKAKLLKNKLPGKADYIQGLQATEQVFGFGISLGPIVGLVQDIFFGTVRSRPGVAPKVKLPMPDLQHWYKAALKMAKAGSILWGYPHETDDDDILSWIAGTLLSSQALMDIQQNWNPLEMVEDLTDLEIKAPEPWHTLTREVINETGEPHLKRVSWPQTGTPWAKIDRLIETTQSTVVDNLRRFLKRNKHNWRGYMAASCSVDGAMFTVTLLEGEGVVHYDHSIPAKIASTLLMHSQRLDPYQPLQKFTDFVHYMIYLDEIDQAPTHKLITSFCQGPAQIKLVDTFP